MQYSILKHSQFFNLGFQVQKISDFHITVESCIWIALLVFKKGMWMQ